jgi:putative hemolysin
MRRLLILLCCAVLVACGGGTVEAPEPTESPTADSAVGIANPASVYCEEQGGTLETRLDAEGNELGICVFGDGSECEEWAFWRGECVPAPVERLALVAVFFGNDTLGDPCEDVFPVERRVSAEDPITGALEQLLAGPTAEEAAEGYTSWFSDQTVDALRALTVDGGRATVDLADLRPIIPNASTSCGSAALLGQLDTTLLQFPEVDETRYQIEGSAEVFYEWLQLSAPDG